MKTIHSKELGDVKYEDKDMFCFPEGLVGLPELKNFVFVEHDDKFGALQSVEDPELFFVITEPSTWDLHMKLEITDGNADILQLQDHHDAWIMYIAHMPNWHPEKMSLNLSGPLIINMKNRTGVQQIVHAHSSDDDHTCIEVLTDECMHVIGMHRQA